ncbi:MAG: hypothetical protein HY075_09015 [Deltaproteobacteria bacterium]|nr:hypothetical protein [Deltaproteobacteria bacterium]
MRYAYHFEFCERPELPEWLRGELFESLGWVQSSFGLERVLGATVPEFVLEARASRLIELGSGSGRGLASVAAGLDRKGARVPTLATDKYPQTELWRARFGGQAAEVGVSWSERAVGFEDFDQCLAAETLAGSVLLLTAAFHHMDPVRARAFLERAADVRASVVVVEPLERSWVGALLGGLAGLPALAAPLSAARARTLAGFLRTVLVHWLVPVVPLILSHDGVVSALRQRTPADWTALTADLPFERSDRLGLGLLQNFSAILLKYPS